MSSPKENTGLERIWPLKILERPNCRGDITVRRLDLIPWTV
jgi:hypothetical protein